MRKRKFSISNVLTTITLVVILLSILLVIPVSLSASTYITFPITQFSSQWYQDLFSDPEWAFAFQNSIIIAICTTILSLLFGIMISLGLRELSNKIQTIFYECFRLPQSVPIIVTAISMYALLSRLHLNGTYLGLIICHTMVAIPFVVSALMAGLSKIGDQYEMAARNLGAGRLQAFKDIVLPMLMPSIGSAALFAFMTSFDEIAITLFVVDPSVMTIPMKMYNGINQQIKPTLAALSALIIVVVALGFILYGCIQLYIDKKSERRI
ncbi:MAG: ABC transporter permease [Absicoccus sp.]|jgi:putative spermidine/putrescine transport system permease protein|uniref:ABC transporter permease n=1 Tax=Absicoccus intestinalis TaxID=2926319 RepID=A0ABU4WM17_9FIRM|nr:MULTISPECIES: ABC transporter permease [unclassified Absicoccus]MDX8416459.1 ABC transporter permease [Absicoccus sp. CLA-KB-P134]MDY3035460.1 ABC transporter permease [Absicoccus sp.]